MRRQLPPAVLPPDLRSAVAACSRALADRPLPVGPAVGGPGAGLAVLRARGDRQAIRSRFHDVVRHAANRPAGSDAARLFDALEDARLDAVGVRWLPGVAVNLLADPGRPPDPVRWLAFESVAGHRAPPDAALAVARLRDATPSELRDALSDLRGVVQDQAAFSAAAAAWAERAAARRWPGGAVPDADPLGARRPTAPDGLPSDSRGGTSPEGEAEGLPALPEPGALDSTAPPGVYAPYTTTHDRVVDAVDVVDRGTLTTLRSRLDAELGEMRPSATRLANRLRRSLMARQLRRWRFDLEEGLLDASRLASVVAAPNEVRPYKREDDGAFPATALTLLLDLSRSMRGRPMIVAALAVDTLVRALERCGVACEVLGFTTTEWDGGPPKREWLARGRPANPGRLNALHHIIIKRADIPWRRARQGLGLVLRDDLLKENIDGEAVAWAHARLNLRPEPRRILIVISDGEPRDEATEEANDAGYLARHLRRTVEEIEDHSAVEIMAVGIAHDVLRFYSRSVKITCADELTEALSRQLTAILTEGVPWA